LHLPRQRQLLGFVNALRIAWICNAWQNKGTTVASSFQRLMIELDRPIQSKDWKGLVGGLEKGTGLINEYLEIFRDIPDEL
jgi:hypothetical protein